MNRSRYARSNYRSSIVSGITTKDRRVCCCLTVVIMTLSQNLLIRGLKCMLKPTSGSPTLIHYLRSEWMLPCSLQDTEGVVVSTATPVIIGSLASPVCMKSLKLSSSTLLLLSTVLSQLLFSPAISVNPRFSGHLEIPWPATVFTSSYYYLFTYLIYIPHEWDRCPYKKRHERDGISLSLSLSLCTICGYSEKVVSPSQEKGPHQNLNKLTPWSQIFKPPELYEINF